MSPAGSPDPGLPGNLRVPVGETVDGLVRVQPAGIGYHPQLGRAEIGLLAAQPSLASSEGMPERRDPGNGHDRRSHLLYETGETLPSLAQFLTTQLGGTDGRPIDQVGYPDARVLKITPLLVTHPGVGINRPVNETGSTQRRIESVGRMTEMGLGSRRPETGVDADEQQLALVTDQVRNGRAAKRL